MRRKRVERAGGETIRTDVLEINYVIDVNMDSVDVSTQGTLATEVVCR